MTPAEIKQARQTLGLTARQLAPLIGYKSLASVYNIESAREKAGGAVIRLLQAYLDGYRPPDWPA
jgi:DNA-binding transcriptional regulator YiaG